MKKLLIIIGLVFVLLGIFVFAAVSKNNTPFTIAELSKFDGKNGNPAYVAIDGAVYDVTNIPSWKGGTHKGNNAGQDVTSVIKEKSPHGLKVLGKLFQVGILVKEITLDELKKYDGKNKNPAYVAVDGIVYDVTNVPSWVGGIHKGNNSGQDITDLIKNKSPHGVKVLAVLPVVGKIPSTTIVKTEQKK